MSPKLGINNNALLKPRLKVSLLVQMLQLVESDLDNVLLNKPEIGTNSKGFELELPDIQGFLQVSRCNCLCELRNGPRSAPANYPNYRSVMP